MIPSAFVASFLASALFVSQTEAATLNGLLKASGHFAKGTAGRRDTGWGGRAVDVDSRGLHDSRDGCPIGWAECSYTTCYPLDGAACCSDGNFCEAGYYCDSGGCCPRGHFCSGGAPPPSTIGGFTTTSKRRFTSVTAGRTTTTTSFEEFPTESSTSTFVGYTPPDQSTVFGTETGDSTPRPTGTGTGTGIGKTFASDPASGSSPTALSGINGAGNGATATVSRNVQTGMGVAAVVAVLMCIA
ncbi:hypothetical protein K466DRAFT_404871 [Polyporus arcularius HHB13444]|uniref:Carbohydrate-binding module family 18 protein n=1 Tax=Polyporus arcularius HHB13444 TaxID=1314778 RepID=A0A5C3NR81_9APHY|nr:hypothetical protein K466DRAFT_404871 [Polyporus arcularius HHB13444]